MVEQILDGSGSGRTVTVNSNNAMETHAVIESSDVASTSLGDSYNINTGVIAYTGTSDSSLMYVKNNEDKDLYIDAIAVGVGEVSATVTDPVTITIINSPTGGDLISDATAVDMNQNRNFGSTKTLSVDAYKGKNGGTVTGGSDVAIFFQSGPGRLFAPINIIVPKGSSIALKIDLGTSGGANVYGAIVCHLNDLG